MTADFAGLRAQSSHASRAKAGELSSCCSTSAVASAELDSRFCRSASPTHLMRHGPRFGECRAAAACSLSRAQGLALLCESAAAPACEAPSLMISADSKKSYGRLLLLLQYVRHMRKFTTSGCHPRVQAIPRYLISFAGVEGRLKSAPATASLLPNWEGTSKLRACAIEPSPCAVCNFMVLTCSFGG